uniref:CopG family transcriptional regulator n=1 Tax=Candidatus Kentrum sp. DK TaxID=2126562 RepID=A0A450RZR0_9GAMM|nr:MAG: hypothetical protein BECKDK2373C_GA0170839_100936 [Candidatus Kentron sp. DK]VFJ44913.1 MAG: hypothetical protein BECKDK2373B_GA0170837_100845 [Candidatus Kentron sp. DK]
MTAAKIAITMEEGLLGRLDLLVKSHIFPSRSRAIQTAVSSQLARMERSRLARECQRLDKHAEQAMAEEGIGHEVDTWPEY